MAKNSPNRVEAIQRNITKLVQDQGLGPKGVDRYLRQIGYDGLDDFNNSVDAAKATRAKAAENVAQMNIAERTAVNVGRELHKLGSGTIDLALQGAERLGVPGASEARSDLRTEQERLNVQYEPMHSQYPIESALARSIPYFVIPGGKAVKGTKFGRGPIGTELTIGAVSGAAHYDETVAGGLASSAVGLGVGGIAGQFLPSSRPVRLNPTQRKIVEWSKNQGYIDMPGFRRGDIRLQQIDQALRTNPQTANILADVEAGNEAVTSNLVGRIFREEGVESLGPETLSRFQKNIRAEFDNLEAVTSGEWRVSDNNKVNNLLDSMMDLQMDDKDVTKVLGFAEQITNAAGGNKRIVGPGKGVIDGGDYKQIYTNINKAKKAAYDSQNTLLGDSLRDLQGILDESLERGSGNLSDWADLRERNAMLELLGSNVDASGKLDMDSLLRGMERDRRTVFQEIDIASERPIDIFRMLARRQDLLRNQRGASLGASQHVGSLLNRRAGPSSVFSLTPALSRVLPEEVGSGLVSGYRSYPFYGVGFPATGRGSPAVIGARTAQGLENKELGDLVVESKDKATDWSLDVLESAMDTISQYSGFARKP